MRRSVYLFIIAVLVMIVASRHGLASKKPPPEASCDKSSPLCVVAIKATNDVHLSLSSRGGTWEGGEGFINGTILNQSNEIFENLAINFTLRDSGEIFGTTGDTLFGSLRPGEKWQFRAIASRPYFLVGRASIDATVRGNQIHSDIVGLPPTCSFGKTLLNQHPCAGW